MSSWQDIIAYVASGLGGATGAKYAVEYWFRGVITKQTADIKADIKALQDQHVNNTTERLLLEQRVKSQEKRSDDIGNSIRELRAELKADFAKLDEKLDRALQK